MSKELNHTCIICGKKYHSCDSCNNVKKITPWKAIADTSNHYQIYLIINDYNYKNIDKKTANDMLSKCDLSDYKNFIPGVLKLIDEILNFEEKEILVDDDAITENVSTVKRTSKRKS